MNRYLLEGNSTYLFNTDSKGLAEIYTKDGKLYFYKPYKKGFFKVNLPFNGIYILETSGEFYNKKRFDLQPYETEIILPKPNRINVAKIKSIKVDKTKDFPARIFAKTGEIVFGKPYLDLPIEARIYISLHEFGHFYYGCDDNDYRHANSLANTTDAKNYIKFKMQQGEKNCDLFALKEFLKMGCNPSQTFIATAGVFRDTEENEERINWILKHTKI